MRDAKYIVTNNNIKFFSQKYINQSYSLTSVLPCLHGLDGLTYNTPSKHRPEPAMRDAHPTSPHHYSNDRKKHGTHRSKLTDRDTRRERRRSCFVARVVFYGWMPFLPPTHQMMSAVVGLPGSSFMS